jgi:hypothetical protein
MAVDLHAQITDALVELRGARTVFDHAPTMDNANLVELCEWRLDTLLGRESDEHTAEAMVTR